MSQSGNTGIRRIIRAAGFSAQGLAYAFRNEAAFRQEIALTAVLTPAAFWLGRTPVEVALLIGVCFIMLIVELINSAIEAAIDRLGDEHHELSGAAKDLGSAAVFVVLCLVGLVWLAVAYDRFLV